MRLQNPAITPTRRDVLVGAAAFSSYPTVVRAAGSMPARGATMLIEGLQSASAARFEPCPYEGRARRLMFNCCYYDLRAGRSESSFLLNGKRLTEGEMRRLTTHAKRQRFLR